MKKLDVLLVIMIVLVSILNYGCEHLCEDEDSSATPKEALLQKTDTLNVSKID